MTGSSRPCKTANLSDSVRRQLNLYAIGATTAGMGILASSEPADAKIVYTPDDLGIMYAEQVPLDLNGDGVADFSFIDYGSFSQKPHSFYLKVRGLAGRNAVVGGNSRSKHCGAAALKAGVQVGPKRHFVSHADMARITFEGSSVTNPMFFYPWANGGKGVNHRYLGIKFTIKGKVHYGWMRFNVFFATAGYVVARLTGYAYETIPNKPITTGQTKGPDNNSIDEAIVSLAVPPLQPASLGILALGASPLSIGRREKSVEDTPKR
jgi:hypothetical protein